MVGEDKGSATRAFFAGRGLEVDWQDSFAYGDSDPRSPSFDLVGHPPSPSPRRELRRARAQGLFDPPNPGMVTVLHARHTNWNTHNEHCWLSLLTPTMSPSARAARSPSTPPAATASSLICATRGEAGEISDPTLATPETLPQVRENELRCAARGMGINPPIFLGYRDSGMKGTPENDDPRSLWQADRHEAVGKVTRLHP